MDKYCIRSGETWEEFEDRQNGILLREELHRRTPDIPAPAPALTIPGDAALADDNAAAEQREEWADYTSGAVECRTNSSAPRVTMYYRSLGYRLVAENPKSILDKFTWRRYPLLSADYD